MKPTRAQHGVRAADAALEEEAPHHVLLFVCSHVDAGRLGGLLVHVVRVIHGADAGETAESTRAAGSGESTASHAAAGSIKRS